MLYLVPVADLEGTFDIDPDAKRSGKIMIFFSFHFHYSYFHSIPFSEPPTPVHIKPQLARSASKIRGLKTQDLNDSGIDPLETSLNRTVPLAPVTSSGYGTVQDTSQPSKDSLKQVHDQVSKRTHRVYPVSSDSEDSSFYTYSPQDSSNGSIRSPEEEGETSPVKASPFSGKPRMATPVHSRRIHSGHGFASAAALHSPSVPRGASDTDGLGVKGHKILSKDIGGKHSALIFQDIRSETPNRISGMGSSISSGDEVSDMREVSVVGQGILNLEKTRADSIDEKNGTTKAKNGKLEYEPEDEEEDEEADEEEDEDEEEEDDEEGEDEEEEDEEEEEDDDSGTVKAESNGKENSDEEEEETKKDDEDIIDDEADESEESSDSDSDSEEKKANENELQRDMTPRTMRKSLSKSTRERMQRKKQMEEERLLKEQQKAESLEREKMKMAQSNKDKEEHLRIKIKKEQQELERMLQKKEKEREMEKQKQKLLQEQLLQQERALTERLQKQQEELEEIEKEKQREKEKEKERFKERMKQKQLRLQKEKEQAEKEREEELIAEKLKLQLKKENELKRKLELEETEKRKRQQQAAKDMKETLEDKGKIYTAAITIR